MKYFAYGSNMSISRLRMRTPGAFALGLHSLKGHDLRFHKFGKDGSGKCDAFYTGDNRDIVFGALFEIQSGEKPALDRAEGLGYGYRERSVAVLASDGSSLEAMTYIATDIDEQLKPFSWYLNHVIVGAAETQLPDDYVQLKINAIEAIRDPDIERDAQERAIHS